MKFQPDSISVQSISGYGPGWIGIGGEKITTSVVIGSRGERFNWSCNSFDELTVEHFAQLAALNTELVIFGSGNRIRFPQGAWIKPLIDKQTGIETMDTQAACRTYNILAGEGRIVAVALLLEPTLGEH
ncbi:MAG: Mth938-like domain-containing protein [Rhodoferax sp.]